MSDFLSFILAVSVVITAAKFGGYLSVRAGQPSVLGELLVGLLLGPTVFDMLNVWPVFAHLAIGFQIAKYRLNVILGKARRRQ